MFKNNYSIIFFAFAFLALLNVAAGMPSMNEGEVHYKEYLEKRG